MSSTTSSICIRPERIPRERIPRERIRRARPAPGLRFDVLAPIYLAVILGLPGVLAAAPLLLVDGGAGRCLFVLLAGPTYAVGYGLTAATIASRYRDSIVPGTFERDLGCERYRARRLYGLCWTSVFYARPIYHLFLCVPVLKRALFRLFGLRSSLEFTAYPDTWIRDLPLLDLGRGAYLSNRATLGTNVVLANGGILVDRVEIGDGALVGHLCMVGPGSSVGRGAELGVGTAVGFRTTIGARARIGPQVSLEHGVHVGEEASIGTRSWVGSGSRIGPGVVVPPATMIPARTDVRTQEDLERFLGRGQRPSERPQPPPRTGASL